eukprot:6181725-Pleurochrysis_carterae.AAC.2
MAKHSKQGWIRTVAGGERRSSALALPRPYALSAPPSVPPLLPLAALYLGYPAPPKVLSSAPSPRLPSPPARALQAAWMSPKPSPHTRNWRQRQAVGVGQDEQLKGDDELHRPSPSSSSSQH